MVLQGDGVLIGVDPANGTERWQLRLPEKAIRYVTPFDAGYACLTRDGRKLFVAANDVIWQVNALSGKVEKELPALRRNMHWGYVAELDDNVYATLMKPTAARTARDLKTRLAYVGSDYRSERPLVTSRHFVCMDQNGSETWSYQSRGVLLHGSIAMDRRQIVFVEARSADCVNHTTDRIPMQPPYARRTLDLSVRKDGGSCLGETPGFAGRPQHAVRPDFGPKNHIDVVKKRTGQSLLFDSSPGDSWRLPHLGNPA